MTLDLPAARRARGRAAGLDPGRTAGRGSTTCSCDAAAGSKRNRPDEILASEGFVIANKLELGDQVPAVINGRLRRLTIVGVALSPEFVYSIRPGELVPDDQRFGIFWMDEKALAAAFDMEGGLQRRGLALSPGASSEEVIARLDRILEPYGGSGRHSARASAVALDGGERAVAASEFRLPAPADLPARRRVHSERRADARAGAAAAADRLAEGPRLRQRGHRLALPEVGLRHRRRRHGHRRVAGARSSARSSSASTTSTSVFPSCSFGVPPSVVIGAAVLTFSAAGAGAFGAVCARCASRPPKRCAPKYLRDTNARCSRRR